MNKAKRGRSAGSTTRTEQDGIILIRPTWVPCEKPSVPELIFISGNNFGRILLDTSGGIVYRCGSDGHWSKLFQVQKTLS
jgi:hypothetical protein